MPGIIVFSEDSALGKQLLTPALELKHTLPEPVTVLTTQASEADALVARGADKVVFLQSDNAWVEGLGEAISTLVSEASVFLVGGTLRGKHLAAYVAARLCAGMTTDAKTLRFEGDTLVATRVLYAGLAVCEEELALPAVVTIPARAYTAPAAVANPIGVVETVAVAADTRVAISENAPIQGVVVDITAANKLVSVGRGFRKQGDLTLAEDLATALHAELACTRGIAEDAHWLPVQWYVGISGQTVKPDLYLAVGLSGQAQHMVGARESKVIVAINTDEHAPIFEAADYGVVGDLYEVLPLLTAALKSRG
jgi:electron transfer flavoprotein alpha subunit